MKRSLRGRKNGPLLDALARWESRAASRRKELGLSPANYAELARNVALTGKAQEDNLGRLASQGAEIRLRRQTELRVISGAADPADPASPAAGAIS